ncbi:hypothetical protein [Roseiflexus castenholzii]|uniref:CcmD family protein n=1 Tax=Roseiflexus castenholzii (strain DSM 13941 / HLO8) TaxID=383372 RepID=A7NS46_ROSCS|nr:hypothetical protein [Roseiflexus castenholzii]ABU60392.1 conserved hypothetical protein [Roseiflexus castenholzii DSM 13941]
MSESTSAIYISMATVLLVWVTIAVYLAQVHAQLRSLRRDVTSDPPGAAQGPEDTTPQPAAVPESPSVAADQWLWMAWYVALTYGCVETLRVLNRIKPNPKAVG